MHCRSTQAHNVGNFDDINSEKSYNSLAAYRQSKLTNNLFIIALADRLRDSNVTVNFIHPGIIRTEIVRHMLPTIPLWRKVCVYTYVCVCVHVCVYVCVCVCTLALCMCVLLHSLLIYSLLAHIV